MSSSVQVSTSLQLALLNVACFQFNWLCIQEVTPLTCASSAKLGYVATANELNFLSQSVATNSLAVNVFWIGCHQVIVCGVVWSSFNQAVVVSSVAGSIPFFKVLLLAQSR